MNERDSENMDWMPLPKGGLRTFAAAQRAMEQRRLAGRVALAIFIAAGVTGGLYLQRDRTAVRPNDPIHAGIACSAVLAELPRFVDGSLSESRMRQIEQHLSECPPCERARRRRLEATGAVDVAAGESRTSRSTQLAVKDGGLQQTMDLLQ